MRRFARLSFVAAAGAFFAIVTSIQANSLTKNGSVHILDKQTSERYDFLPGAVLGVYKLPKKYNGVFFSKKSTNSTRVIVFRNDVLLFDKVYYKKDDFEDISYYFKAGDEVKMIAGVGHSSGKWQTNSFKITFGGYSGPGCFVNEYIATNDTSARRYDYDYNDANIGIGLPCRP